MAISSYWYGMAFVSAFNKLIDLDSDVIKVMLTTSTYVPNQDTHQFKSSVTNEIVGAGYSAGGATLTTPVMSYTAGTNVFKFSADQTVWTSSTITARYAVVYDYVSAGTADSARPLLFYVDFGVNQNSAGGNFTLAWSSAGLLTVTAG